jgi:hypothetical protein
MKVIRFLLLIGFAACAAADMAVCTNPSVRGFNYVRLENPRGGKHTTFAPGAYDPAAAGRMFDALQSNRCNAVRVFVSLDAKSSGSLFCQTPSGELSKDYMDNFCDFLRQARARGIRVMPNFESLPLHDRYRKLAGSEPSRLTGANRMYLDSGYIKARQQFLADFIQAIRQRDPGLLRAILAYNVENEDCFAIAYPFDATEGTFTAPNGRTYDLAREKTALADDAAVYWVNAMADAIKAADPEACVDVSVFTYRAVSRTGPGDFKRGSAPWNNRYPFRPLALASSKADIVDIHLYPRDERELAGHLKSVEWDALKEAAAREGKTLLCGEFGVFRSSAQGHADLASAASWSATLAARLQEVGFHGWLFWQYDTAEQPELWNAMEGHARIFHALGAVQGPGMKPRGDRGWADPGQDVLVATHRVADYGAIADDGQDDTPAFQKALDAARDAGGGIVYAPAGRYTFRGRLTLHSAVTLRGDWTPPGTKAPHGLTRFEVYWGKSQPEAPDFILVQAGACLRDVTLHYPEQSFAQVIPFAPAIGLSGNAAAVRLTLVNPYRGIRGVPSAIVHYIRDCHGTPLHEGIWIDVCTDVGRILNTTFSPDCWEQSGLPGAPTTDHDRLALRQHLLQDATGIRIGYSDAEHLANVRVSGYKTGLWLTRRTDGKESGLTVHSYGEAAGVVLEDCGEALRCDYANHIVGWRFSASRFAGRDAAVRGTGGSTLQFAGCSFAAEQGAAIRFPRKADIEVILGFKKVASDDVFSRTGMTFHACRFEAWEGVAIDALSGMLSVTDSDFLADRPAASLGPELVAATLVGNRFAGEPRIRSGCARVAMDHKPLQWDNADLRPHGYAADPRPHADAVIHVREPAYGAAGDGKADAAATIQKALDAAAKDGGTVFLRAGIYRCARNLTVPPGVELRGVGGARSDASLAPAGGPGTLLLAATGPGDADAAPFIRLQSRAGVRGIRVAHPGLFDLARIEPHPWAVRLEGEGAYVLDLCLNNCYRGVDVRADRTLVRNVLVNALDLAVRAEGCLDAVIEDVHVHPQYMASLVPLVSPGVPFVGPQGDKARLALFEAAIARAKHHTTCFAVGACRGLRFVNPSTWPSDVGFRVTSPDAEVQILNCTLETNTPLWLEQAGRIELVNANAPVVGIRSGLKFAGQAHVVNYLLRTGHTDRQSLDLQGPGSIRLTQCWFKWIPRGGQELLFQNGNLHLLGGMMVDVKDWQRGKGSLALTGTIVNAGLFSRELAGARASAGVTPCK